jgi:hypothetical protein
MEWLSQNWIWLAFAAAMIFMMRRGGAGGCCGGHGSDDKATEGAKPGNAGAASCCGGGEGANDKQAADSAQSRPAPAAPAQPH